MRGGETIEQITQRGIRFEEEQDTLRAIQEYKRAVTVLAEPINYLAWMYHETNRTEDALTLSRIAVQLAPNDANALDTLAEILFKMEDYESALFYIEKAARLNERYQSKIDRFRRKTL